MDPVPPTKAVTPEGADSLPPAASAPSRRIPLLGTLVDAISFQETLDRIESIVASGRPTQHVVLNAAKVVAVHDDPALNRIVPKP